MLIPRTETHAAELKRYLRFGREDAARLAAFADRARPHLRRIATEFYERIREHEDAHAVLSGEAQIARLQNALVGWLERLLAGTYDDAYFARTTEIGRVHFNVGLPQRFMPVAMALLRTALGALAVELAGDEGPAIGDALSRLLDIELAVMLESYHDRVVARIERAAAARSVGELHRASREEEAALTAVDLAPLLVITLDADGRIDLFNREAERLTGYAEDEVRGRDFVGLLLPKAIQDQHRATFTSAHRGLDVPLETRAGVTREIRWEVATAPPGATATTFAFGIDVTEEATARSLVQQERRLAALGTLAAGLAHEIRNPLNGARLHVQLLERALAKRTDNSDDLEATRVVGGEIERLARLVTEFLEFAQPRALVTAPVKLGAIVDRAVRSVAAPNGIVVEVDLPKAEVVVDVDQERLERVLANLVENAVEAIDGKGKVVLRARREPRFVRLEVEDNGPGIPPEAPVFDAFFSTKTSGTGLGLAIVHRIVTDHGGTIEVDSRPGRTIFRMKLPLK